MKNYLQHGDTLTLPAPTGGVVAGLPYLIGALFGVAMTTADETVDFDFRLKGVFENLPKATGATWSIGDALYWDNTAKKLTKTAGDNLQVGVAIVAAGSADTVGTARLNEGGTKLTGLLAPSAAIPDLAAITSGDGPTEAEHNAVRSDLAAIKAVLRAHNILAD